MVESAIVVTSSDGWSRLFASAFQGSRNAMLLTDDERTVLDVNGAFLALSGRKRDAVVGRPLWEQAADGPLMSRTEWTEALAAGRFDGDARIRSADGRPVAVQWAASTETVTGGRRVLVVALNVSRWGSHFRRTSVWEPPLRSLSRREREVVRLVSLGAAGPEIADELHISHETVRTHVRNAMEKLGARSRAHLVAKALGEGHSLG